MQVVQVGAFGVRIHIMVETTAILLKAQEFMQGQRMQEAANQSTFRTRRTMSSFISVH
jgi:DNA-directed RNA polymerase subunit E'/Rpb7